MPSTSPREIIGDIRYTLNKDLTEQYPKMDGIRGFLHTTEAYFIRAIYNVDPKELSADYYIAPGDGGGPIVVEVGEMEEDKWGALISTDGKPVRVLRVGLDRMISLLNPRHTQFEGDLLSVLGAHP